MKEKHILAKKKKSMQFIQNHTFSILFFKDLWFSHPNFGGSGVRR